LLNNISQLPITVLCATALVSSNVSWSILDWNYYLNLCVRDRMLQHTKETLFSANTMVGRRWTFSISKYPVHKKTGQIRKLISITHWLRTRILKNPLSL
jgi:hypothetical protein